MYCSYCGAKIPDQAKFCRNCGAKCSETVSEPKKEAEPLAQGIKEYFNAKLEEEPNYSTKSNKINIAEELASLPLKKYLKWVFVGTCIYIVILMFCVGTSMTERDKFYKSMSSFSATTILYMLRFIIIPGTIMFFMGYKKAIMKTILLGSILAIAGTGISENIANGIRKNFPFLVSVFFYSLEGASLGFILSMSVGDIRSIKKLAISGVLVVIMLWPLNAIMLHMVNSMHDYAKDIAAFHHNYLYNQDFASVIFFNFSREFISNFLEFSLLPVAYRFLRKHDLFSKLGF